MDKRVALKEWLTEWRRADKELRARVKGLPLRKRMKFSVRVIAKALQVGLVVSIVPSVIAFVVILGVVGFKFHWPALPIVWVLLAVGVVAVFLVSLRYFHPREMTKLLETIE